MAEDSDPADPYRKIESEMEDAKNASIVLVTLLEDTLTSSGEHVGLKQFLLTDDQVNALFFVTYQLDRIVRKLYDEYHEGYTMALSHKGVRGHD
jgi:hypothetical protein